MSSPTSRAPSASCAVPRGLALELDHGPRARRQALELEREDLAELAALEDLVLERRILELALADLSRADLELEDLAALDLVLEDLAAP